MVRVRVIEAIECAFGNCEGGIGGEAVVGVREDNTEVVTIVGRSGRSKGFGERVVVMQWGPAGGIELDAETGVFTIGFGGVFEEVDFVFQDGVEKEAGWVVGHVS